MNEINENIQSLPTDPVPEINVVNELPLTNNVKCEEDPLGDDDATPERQQTYDRECTATPVHSPYQNTGVTNGKVICVVKDDISDAEDDIPTPRHEQESPSEGEIQSPIRQLKTNYSSDEELPNDFFDELLNPKKTEPYLQEPHLEDAISNPQVYDIENSDEAIISKTTENLERKRFKIEHELQMLGSNTLSPKNNKRKKKKHHKRSDSDVIHTTHRDRHNCSEITERRKSHRIKIQVSNSDDDELLFERRAQRSHSKNNDRRLEQDRTHSGSSSQSPGPSNRKRQRRCSTNSEDSNRLRCFDQAVLEQQFKPIKLEKLLAHPIPLAITPEEKIRIAVFQAENLIKHFKEKSTGLLKEFIFTPTIRPAINTGSLISISTNTSRSPLSSNNVTFQLTSTGANIDIALYGLQQPPPATVEVMRLMQFDIIRLEEKRKNVRMPPKVLKRIIEAKTRDKSDDFGVTQSLLYKDAKTQTYDTYFAKLTNSVGTQCRDENFIDTSLMNERQKYAIYLCQKLILTLPRNATEEMQQSTNLLDAIKVARGSLRRIN